MDASQSFSPWEVGGQGLGEAGMEKKREVGERGGEGAEGRGRGWGGAGGEGREGGAGEDDVTGYHLALRVL